MSDVLENLSNVEEQDEEFPEVKEDIKVWQRRRDVFFFFFNYLLLS